MVVLASFWAPSWGPCWAHLGPWSAQAGSRTHFEPSYLRKSGCSQNTTFYKGLGRSFAQEGAPRRPKIAPRWVQDRLGSLFVRLDLSLRFLIVLGSMLMPFWVPKWFPRGGGANYANRPLGGSKTVLGSSGFGPFFVLRFGFVFWSLLGASWACTWGRSGPFGMLPGAVLAFLDAFECFLAPQTMIPSTRRFKLSTRQLTRLGSLFFSS